MPFRHRRVAATMLILGAAACAEQEPAVSNDLERDLAQARASSIELAPRTGGRTDVVSAEEQLPPGTRRMARRAPAARPRATAPPRPVVAERARETPPASVAEAAPDVESAPGAPATAEATLPPEGARPRPVEPAPTRRGPYKSVGEVIRDAPFPIHP